MVLGEEAKVEGREDKRRVIPGRRCIVRRKKSISSARIWVGVQVPQLM